MNSLYFTLNFSISLPKLQFGGNIPSLAQLGFIVTDKIDKCTLYNAYVTQSDFYCLFLHQNCLFCDIQINNVNMNFSLKHHSQQHFSF